MITYTIIAINVILSLIAFQNDNLFRKLEYSPYLVVHNKEQYRIFTHAFIHGDYGHLLINMFVLYQFGRHVESGFSHYFGVKGILYYIVLYLGGIIAASIPAIQKNKDNPLYSAIGASGAVSAVLFSFILMNPTAMLGLFLIIPMPAFLVGILYLIYEKKMNDRNDRIAHDAHYWGAIFGFGATLIFKPAFGLEFLADIQHSIANLF